MAAVHYSFLSLKVLVVKWSHGTIFIKFSIYDTGLHRNTDQTALYSFARDTGHKEPRSWGPGLVRL